MEIYTAATKGEPEMMTEMLEIQKYSILEEVSKQGFFWTAFHFASHYGKVEVLRLLIDKFISHPHKADIYNL